MTHLPQRDVATMQTNKKKAAETVPAAAAASQSCDEEPESLESAIGLIKSKAAQFTTFNSKIECCCSTFY